ncbi:MAG: hypothetical protein ABL908_14445 [Hyphomicrobium sp.]
MASTREVKKLLEPLMRRNEDLVLVGRTIVVRPVRHIMLAILIDRTRSADMLHPRWYIHHFCTPAQHMGISWGGDIYRGERKLWLTSDPELPERLASAIEGVLPRLRAIKTLEHFVAAVRSHLYAYHHLEWPEVRVVIELALGNLETARSICEENIVARQMPTSDNPDFILKKHAGAKELCRLISANDIAGAVELLHTWEAALVKQEKLEPYWERTPFPVEALLGPGVSFHL